jgi:hypothetical protein
MDYAKIASIDIPGRGSPSLYCIVVCVLAAEEQQIGAINHAIVTVRIEVFIETAFLAFCGSRNFMRK